MVTTRAENRRINEIDGEMAERKRAVKDLEELDWDEWGGEEFAAYTRHHRMRLTLVHELQGIKAYAENRVSNHHRALNVHLAGRGRQVTPVLRNAKLLECLGYLTGERATDILRTTSRASRSLYIEEAIRHT